MPTRITGQVAPLPIANIDTDIIMPKRFLRTITREGLADGTFADMRFDEDGSVRHDFILNQSQYRRASILVAGDNFGCGSSREHAVWGLTQLGIQGIVGTTFAGIFYDNARKNGLALPMVSPVERDELVRLSAHNPGLEIDINLEDQTITGQGVSMSFEMDAGTRQALLDDRDDTLDTLKLQDKILAFETALPDTQKIHVAK